MQSLIYIGFTSRWDSALQTDEIETDNLKWTKNWVQGVSGGKR